MQHGSAKNRSGQEIIYDCTRTGDTNPSSATGDGIVECIAIAADAAETPRIDIYV